MDAVEFQPSEASYADAASWLQSAKSAFTSSASGISGWSALVNAITDPRERVATLKAKIVNYKKMKEKYGFGPVGDLYANEIRLMKARLSAEKKGLEIQEEGEGATWVWRAAAWGIAGTIALYFGAKAYQAVTSSGTSPARVTNPEATDAEIDRAYEYARRDRLPHALTPDRVADYLEVGTTADLARVRDRMQTWPSRLRADHDRVLKRDVARLRRRNGEEDRLVLASLPDGWAEVRDGRDRQAYRRWALCASRDGRRALAHYKNGGPVALLRPTSGKASQPPLWHSRAIGYVRFVGGMPMPGLYDVADWYARHRSGSYPVSAG